MDEVSKVSIPTRPKKLVTIPEAAAICEAEGLGLTERMIRGLVLTGRIPVIKMGNRSYLNMDALREAIKDPNSALYQ